MAEVKSLHLPVAFICESQNFLETNHPIMFTYLALLPRRNALHTAILLQYIYTKTERKCKTPRTVKRCCQNLFGSFLGVYGTLLYCSICSSLHLSTYLSIFLSITVKINMNSILYYMYICTVNYMLITYNITYLYM